LVFWREVVFELGCHKPMNGANLVPDGARWTTIDRKASLPRSRVGADFVPLRGVLNVNSRNESPPRPDRSFGGEKTRPPRGLWRHLPTSKYTEHIESWSLDFSGGLPIRPFHRPKSRPSNPICLFQRDMRNAAKRRKRELDVGRSWKILEDFSIFMRTFTSEQWRF
jgi:hypothetical protein